MQITSKWLLLIVSILTITSCQKDDKLSAPQEFSNTRGGVFSYQTDDDNITFLIDDINNSTNNLTGDFPEADFYRIYVDFNNNGTLDDGVDLMFGPQSDGRICVVTLKSQTSTSGCAYYDDVTGESLFSTTANDEIDHVNYTITIPKSRLSNSSSIANITIRMHDEENGYAQFPGDSPLFTDTFEISW